MFPQIEKNTHLGTPLLVGNPYQTIGIVERQGTQQQSVHHAEYGGTGADAETGDKNHKRGEAGIAPHSAKRVTQILRQIAHPAGNPYGAGFF